MGRQFFLFKIIQIKMSFFKPVAQFLKKCNSEKRHFHLLNFNQKNWRQMGFEIILETSKPMGRQFFLLKISQIRMSFFKPVAQFLQKSNPEKRHSYLLNFNQKKIGGQWVLKS